MAVAIDATGTASLLTSQAVNSTYTGITVGSGSNMALIVTLMFDTATVTTITVTWDNGGTNQVMTQIVGDQQFMFVFGLLNPTAGNKTLNVAFNGGTSGVAIEAISFTGVNQTGGTSSFTSTTNSGTSTSASATISSATGNWIVGLFESGSILSALSGTTMYNDNTPTLVVPSAADNITGSSSVTISATVSPSSIWNAIAVNVIADTGSGAAPILMGKTSSRIFGPGKGVIGKIRNVHSQKTWLISNINLVLTGVQSNTSVGTFTIGVSPGVNISVSSGSGAGSFTPGITEGLIGAIDASAVAISLAELLGLSGGQAVSSTAAFTPGVTIILGSAPDTSTVGSFTPGVNITLTGAQSNTVIGNIQFITVIPGNGLNSQGGSFISGISDALGSVSDSTSAGNFTIAVSITLAGASDVTSLGSFIPAISKILPAISDSTTAGTLGVNVQPTFTGASDASTVASTGILDNDLIVGVSSGSSVGNLSAATNFFQGVSAASLIGTFIPAISIALSSASSNTAAGTLVASLLTSLGSALTTTSSGTMNPGDIDALQSVLDSSGASSFIEIVNIPLSIGSSSVAGSLTNTISPRISGTSTGSGIGQLSSFQSFFNGVLSKTTAGNFSIAIFSRGFNLSGKFLKIKLRNDGTESPYITTRIYDGNQILLNPGIYTEIYMPLVDIPFQFTSPLPSSIPLKVKLVANGVVNT